MKRVFLLLAAGFLGIACLVSVMWIRVWGPDARAMEVAEILAGRSYDVDAIPDATLADELQHLTFRVREKLGLIDAVHDVKWASLELSGLAHSHPEAIAHAAVRERSADVRFGMLDAIEGTPAWASEVPAPLQLEHVTSHVVQRLDRPTSRGLDEAEKAALTRDRDEALRALSAELAHGHCGALAGFDALGEKPQAMEIQQAIRAVATAAADPDAEMLPAAQENCRETLGRLLAPSTNGGFGVTAPTGSPDAP